ncbi:MAG: DUF1348 family protein [Rhodanobacter sp.]
MTSLSERHWSKARCNRRGSAKVAPVYVPDSRRCVRAKFVGWRETIETFLTRKRQRDL